MKTGMRWARVMLLGAVSAIAIAACTGDDDDDGSSPTLESGTYVLTMSSVGVDSCWPGDEANPPIAGVPVTMDLTLVGSTGGFTYSMSGTGAAAYLFAGDGIGSADEDGNIQLQTSDPFEVELILTTSCTLLIGGSGAGDVTESGFEGSFFTGIKLAALNSAGTAVADCTTHPATIFDGFVPFPPMLAGTASTLSNCGTASEGTAVLQ